MKTTCIMCPVGCQLDIQEIGGKVIVRGNACPRGETYGIDEFTAPKRIVTSVVKTVDGYASVKTTNPVPKEKVFDVLSEIEKIKPTKVGYQEILIKNVLGLNTNIVVTGFHCEL